MWGHSNTAYGWKIALETRIAYRVSVIRDGTVVLKSEVELLAKWVRKDDSRFPCITWSSGALFDTLLIFLNDFSDGTWPFRCITIHKIPPAFR